MARHGRSVTLRCQRTEEYATLRPRFSQRLAPLFPYGVRCRAICKVSGAYIDRHCRLADGILLMSRKAAGFASMAGDAAAIRACVSPDRWHLFLQIDAIHVKGVSTLLQSMWLHSPGALAPGFLHRCWTSLLRMVGGALTGHFFSPKHVFGRADQAQKMGMSRAVEPDRAAPHMVIC